MESDKIGRPHFKSGGSRYDFHLHRLKWRCCSFAHLRLDHSTWYLRDQRFLLLPSSQANLLPDEYKLWKMNHFTVMTEILQEYPSNNVKQVPPPKKNLTPKKRCPSATTQKRDLIGLIASGTQPRGHQQWRSLHLKVHHTISEWFGWGWWLRFKRHNRKRHKIRFHTSWSKPADSKALFAVSGLSSTLTLLLHMKIDPEWRW